jgi:hypothetical protein
VSQFELQQPLTAVRIVALVPVCLLDRDGVSRHAILLTHGRHHETISGEPHTVDEGSLPTVVEYAKDLIRQEQRRRGDGLPDGYRILNERGQQVFAEWLGMIDA